MPQASMVGSRIRERRVMSGIRQIDLAQRAGISPSYLNLIEHNRRRIGGKTLLQLAHALEVEPAWLSEGAEATLIAGLSEAAGAHAGHSAELDRIQEFAGRFPGWASLLSDTARRSEELKQTVQALTDRLAHDPHLAASLHEVISTVTAIRATASILADTKELEPEWRARFNRNVNEDSRRLAEGAEALVRYLEDAPDKDADIRSPQDEVHAFMTEHGFHFPELESGKARQIAQLLAAAPTLTSDAGRSLARVVLEHYIRDATALPLEIMSHAIAEHGMRPDLMLPALGVAPGCVFRRLAALPDELTGPVGLVMCDSSGSILFRKPLSGFDIPRAAGACPLWPLYQALTQSHAPISARLIQNGAAQGAIQSYSLAEQQTQARFDLPAQLRAYMLLVPADQTGGDAATRHVGSTCRICPQEKCAARREPSIIAKGF